jgi:hypothetical protein
MLVVCIYNRKSVEILVRLSYEFMNILFFKFVSAVL